MIIFAINIAKPLIAEPDHSYVSGRYSLKVKDGFVYIYLDTKQIRKIKIEICKEIIAKYGFRIEEKKEIKKEKFSFRKTKGTF